MLVRVLRVSELLHDSLRYPLAAHVTSTPPPALAPASCHRAAATPGALSELQALEAQAGGLHSPSPLHPPVPRAAVVVCHSLPTNWHLPEPTAGADDQCPPAAVKAGYVYLVGRTMFETDR